MTNGRYQEEIEYLKRQLEMADHNIHDNSHVLNNMKYDKQRVLHPPNSRVTAFAPGMPSNSDPNRGPSGPSGGLPGVLSSLKSESGGVIAGVVAGVVAGGRGVNNGAGRGSALPPTPGIRAGAGIRGSLGNGRPVDRGVMVVGPGPQIEGGEESSSGLIIEEQDIVMASVNPSEK